MATRKKPKQTLRTKQAPNRTAPAGADPLGRLREMLASPTVDAFLLAARILQGQRSRPEARALVAAQQARLVAIATDRASTTEQAATAARVLEGLGVTVKAAAPAGAEVAKLLKQARAKDEFKRAEAIEALAKVEDSSTEAVLLEGLDDPQRVVRKAAMRAVGARRLAAGLPRLLAHRDADAGAVRARVEALAAFGGTKAEAALASETLFAQVTRHLTRQDAVAAVRALALLRTKDLPRRLAEVAVGLPEDLAQGRAELLDLVIARAAPEAVPALVEGALDPKRHPELREELIWALRGVAAKVRPTPSALAAVRAMLKRARRELPKLELVVAEAVDPLGGPAPAWGDALGAKDAAGAALLFGAE